MSMDFPDVDDVTAAVQSELAAAAMECDRVLPETPVMLAERKRKPHRALGRLRRQVMSPPVSSGEIIGGAFGMYRAHWQHFVGVGLTVFFVVAMIALVLAFLGPVGLLLSQLVVIAGSVVLTGALVTAVDDVRDGRVDLSVGETISRVRPVFWVLLGVGIVAGIAIGIGLVFFIIPGLWLATMWFVLAPVIVLERAGFGASFGRSRGLVKQSGWATFGLLVLTFLILFAAVFVVALILSPLPIFLANFISTLVQGAVFAPFTSIVVTLAYFRLREMEGARTESESAQPSY